MELFGLLILILAIISILEAISRKMPLGKKVLWIVLIAFLPVLGIFLYYLVGRPDA